MDKIADNALVLGLMSGTSLDGLDLALCNFSFNGHLWQYKILKADTIPYDAFWKTQLSTAKDLSAEAYFELNARYGKMMGEEVIQFLKGQPMPAAIASHGHTIFHQPLKGFSAQMGCGANIAAVTGITTVCDFRSLDVALKGQGAPLVPIGDQLLFSEYDACLNIGGITNISYTLGNERKAYDICVANMLLNYLAEKAGMAYDDGGSMAKSGKINEALLKELNGHDFYKRLGAKSLGREWFELEIVPLMKNASLHDLMRTATEHIAKMISDDLNRNRIIKVLVSGGGALNHFLMQRISELSNAAMIIPDLQTIQFKEALIFAFLGHLRLHSEVNTLSAVTGASCDSIGGAVYLGA